MRDYTVELIDEGLRDFSKRTILTTDEVVDLLLDVRRAAVTEAEYDVEEADDDLALITADIDIEQITDDVDRVLAIGQGR